jgi:hypothetical protein
MADDEPLVTKAGSPIVHPRAELLLQILREVEVEGKLSYEIPGALSLYSIQHDFVEQQADHFFTEMAKDMLLSDMIFNDSFHSPEFLRALEKASFIAEYLEQHELPMPFAYVNTDLHESTESNDGFSRIVNRFRHELTQLNAAQLTGVIAAAGWHNAPIMGIFLVSHRCGSYEYAAAAMVSSGMDPEICGEISRTEYRKHFQACASQARLINEYIALADPRSDEEREIDRLLELHEGSRVEFKSSFRKNLKTGEKKCKDVQLSALKTLCGFMNARGGTLLIGVSDDKQVLGTEEDGFESIDHMQRHIVEICKNVFGADVIGLLDVRNCLYGGKIIVLVEVLATPKARPRYLKWEGQERFYARCSARTEMLEGEAIHRYWEGRNYQTDVKA